MCISPRYQTFRAKINVQSCLLVFPLPLISTGGAILVVPFLVFEKGTRKKGTDESGRAALFVNVHFGSFSRAVRVGCALRIAQDCAH